LSPVGKGTPVFVQPLKKCDPVRWFQETQADNCSDRSYIVEIDGRLLRRNRQYLQVDHPASHILETQRKLVAEKDESPPVESRETEVCDLPAVSNTPRPTTLQTSPKSPISQVKTQDGEEALAISLRRDLFG